MLLISFWFGSKTHSDSAGTPSEGKGASLKSARLPSSKSSLAAKSGTDLNKQTGDSRLQDFFHHFEEEADPLERLSLLLLHLDRCTPQDFRDLAHHFPFRTAHESSLFFHAWMQSQGVAEVLALSSEESVERFRIAFNVALQSPDLEQQALQWQALNQEPGEVEFAEIDVEPAVPVEVAETNEGSDLLLNPATVALADFPTGLSVHSTARRISEVASRNSAKARDWIRYSSDRRAVLQSAIDVGWNSTDLTSAAFNDYLQTLDSEVASLVAAGYIQQLAAASPEALPEVAADLGEWTNIDLGLYLVTEVLLANTVTNVELTATLVSYIGDLNLQGHANDLVAEFTATVPEVISVEGRVAGLEVSSADQDGGSIANSSTASQVARDPRSSAQDGGARAYIEDNFPGILGD